VDVPILEKNCVAKIALIWKLVYLVSKALAIQQKKSKYTSKINISVARFPKTMRLRHPTLH